MRRWRGRRAALLVLVGALALAGCGQGTTPGADGDDGFEISTVADSTEAAGTARFEGSFETADPDDPPGSRFDGEIDFANERWVMRSPYEDPEAEGRVVEGEQRMIDGYLYTTNSLITSEPGMLGPEAKPWIRMGFPGASGAFLPTAGSADVGGYLATFEAMGATAEEVGSEAVRGTPTTRYRLTVGELPDVAAQIEAMGEYADDAAEEQTIDLWADAEGRLRRFRSEDGSAHDSGGGTYEIELFDFGAPVTIEAPPADQVFDASMPMGGDPATYELVTSGGSGATAWKVFVSPAEDGRCVEVEAEFLPVVAAARGADGGRIHLSCMGGPTIWPGPDGEPVEVSTPTFVEPDALPLADGGALLLSNVPDGTTGVTLRLRGGGARDVTPENGWFGTVLEADEVVERIVFDGAPPPSGCRLGKRYGYECDQVAFDSGPGSGSASGSSSSRSSSGASSSSVSTRAPATAP